MAHKEDEIEQVFVSVTDIPRGLRIRTVAVRGNAMSGNSLSLKLPNGRIIARLFVEENAETSSIII